MAIDFSHYNPPGVYINPQPGPQLAVNSSLPQAVALFGQALGYQNYIQTVQVNPDTTGTLTPTVSVTTTTQGVAAVNDVQTVVVTGSAGTFTLSFGGQTIATPLAYNASPGAVQTAFQALSSVGAGNATVGGQVGNYVITFVGSLAGAPQGNVTAAGSGGAAATPTHTTTGVVPVNEVQVITIGGGAGGTFTLSKDAASTTPIAYNATSGVVQAALTALGTIGSNNATVSGGAGGPYTVTFVGSLAGTNIATLTGAGSPTLTPSLTQTFANGGINLSSIVVTNPNSGAVYALNTDYTITQVSGAANTPTALFALQRNVSGHINPGDFVQVQYQYTNADYYKAQLFYDYQDITSTYGQPFNLSTGVVQSELSLAAQFAILNGAEQIVCVAVQPTGNNGTATIGDYGNALAELSDDPLVAIVVGCTGQQPLFQLVQEHVDQQSTVNYERRAILGMDGTVTPVPSSQRIINAQELTDQRIALVSPATFTHFSGEVNNSVTLGGQYMAASLAGMAVAMSYVQPLTRKVITGWDDVTEKQLDGQKNLESSNGLMVVEKTRQNLIWVRHGVTTNPTDLITREWSITGQQDAMAYRLRDYLNAANLIGQPIYPYTLINVKASAEAALQSLLRDGLLVNYTGLKVRQLLTNPDVIEITYNWFPAFPLNYIVVTFAISLTTGSTTSTAVSSTSNSSNVGNTSQTTVSTITAPSTSSTNDFGGSSNTLQSD